jgi:catechol 2,3-dioxygenase-like lactoylglutathione lyase family enzyme
MVDGPILNQVNLVVTDMAATVAFYRRLGLTIPETDPDWAHQHRTAKTPGDIDLDFDSAESVRMWDQGWSEGHRMGVLGFRVPSREVTPSGAADTRSFRTPTRTLWGS